MAISKARILDAIVDAVEADGKYDALSGDALADAKQSTRDGCAYIVDAIVDEIQANAQVTGTIDTDPTDGLRDGEILEAGIS